MAASGASGPDTCTDPCGEGIYGLLASIFRREPDAALLDYLRSAPVLEALAEAGVDTHALVAECCRPGALERLAVEYARLFIGPGKHHSPHESVQSPGDGRLMGRTSIEVRGFLRAMGVEFRTDYHGLPDHLSVELELLQVLETAARNARDNRDEALAVECEALGQRFLDEHPGRWAPAFCEAVARDTPCAYFRELAGLARAYLLSARTEAGSRRELNAGRELNTA